ncbi:MAG: hypothetical protein ACJAZ1_002984 [Yoonia sp.]|jgi:hypothetical protein
MFSLLLAALRHGLTSRHFSHGSKGDMLGKHFRRRIIIFDNKDKGGVAVLSDQF